MRPAGGPTGPGGPAGEDPVGPSAPPPAPGSPAAVVEAVLEGHPDMPSVRLDDSHWLLTLQGEVRLAIPVSVEVGPRTWTVTSFLMRGPREGRDELYRNLLRKNLGTSRVRLALDADDDVLMVARLPLSALNVAELEEVLGEIYSLSEGSFEALVHLGYPGVFPPLRRGERTT